MMFRNYCISNVNRKYRERERKRGKLFLSSNIQPLFHTPTKQFSKHEMCSSTAKYSVKTSERTKSVVFVPQWESERFDLREKVIRRKQKKIQSTRTLVSIFVVLPQLQSSHRDYDWKWNMRVRNLHVVCIIFSSTPQMCDTAVILLFFPFFIVLR